MAKIPGTDSNEIPAREPAAKPAAETPRASVPKAGSFMERMRARWRKQNEERRAPASPPVKSEASATTSSDASPIPGAAALAARAREGLAPGFYRSQLGKIGGGNAPAAGASSSSASPPAHTRAAILAAPSMAERQRLRHAGKQARYDNGLAAKAELDKRNADASVAAAPEMTAVVSGEPAKPST